MDDFSSNLTTPTGFTYRGEPHPEGIPPYELILLLMDRWAKEEERRKDEKNKHTCHPFNYINCKIAELKLVVSRSEVRTPYTHRHTRYKHTLKDRTLNKVLMTAITDL